MEPSTAALDLVDHEPQGDDVRRMVLEGLSRPQKRLPCKLLYDAYGSKLFDRICECADYYPTRTELAIMERDVDEMADAFGPDCVMIEYGSGSSMKTHLLLDHLDKLAAYVPIDISREHLLNSAARINEAYPELPVLPVCADYTRDFSLPELPPEAARRVGYFPGSTIGNFEPNEALAFLRRVARQLGEGGGLILGVDLKKDPAILRQAYNDREGVTAAFNRNVLRRINRELGAKFNLDGFAHEARWNGDRGRIEMHLVSLRRQDVDVAGRTFHFDEGETIHTENSCKYRPDEFAALAADAGFHVRRVWTDDAPLFSVQYLTVR